MKYYGMTYNHPSMFITKKEYNQHMYNIELRSMSDFQFVLECLLTNRNNFFYLNHAIVNYRLDGISAKLPLIKSLKEGFISRENAGLSFFENIFSLNIRIIVHLINKFRNSQWNYFIYSYIIY